jgi:hypothetical protein
MRIRLFVTAVAVLIAAAPAEAARIWTAYCNDGRNLVYAFNANGPGVLSMQIAVEGEPNAIIGIANSTRTSETETVVCGSASPDDLAFGGETPISQLCIDAERGVMFVVYNHPFEERATLTGIYCEADVRIREE